MKQLIRATVLLLVLLSLGIWLTAGPSRPAARPEANEPAKPVSGPPAVPSADVLDSSLRALADGERASARDRWDPEWLAARLGPDPDRILAWVRGRTAWIPYHGTLRGARGVLLDRQGNSLDRALLLATLLEHAGHKVRLAHGDIGPERALELLPELVGRRRTTHGVSPGEISVDTAWRPSVREAAARYGLDTIAVERALGRGVDSTEGALATLERRVEDQARRLRAFLPGTAKAHPRTRVEAALLALRDHWWVQRLDGERWTDLDPLGEAPGATGAPGTTEVRALPDSLYHRVTVRLVTERWSRGALGTRVAFESELRPSQLSGEPISVQIWPSDWPAEILPSGGDPRAAMRSTALAQRAWRAVLLVGQQASADVVIEETGAVQQSGAGGPMDGLGRGMVGALGGGRADDGVLTAAWLDYEVQVPGASARRERRVLFDLPGVAARAKARLARPELDDTQRLTRNLALMRQTEILLLGSVPDPGFVLHLAARATQANVLLLRTRQKDDSAASAGFASVADRIVAPPSPLYTLAMTRFAWDARGDVYLDRPNLLSRHIWLRPGPGGVLRGEANDIVFNEVGVAVDAGDVVATRVRQGIRDTNGEALFPLGARALQSVGEAFATPGDWVFVGGSSAPMLRSLRVSEDTRHRMEEELAAGYVLVVPRSSNDSGAADVEGWWRVDPETGHTLGVSSTGWGQTLLERAVKYAGIFSAAWAFEYLICRNGLYGLPGEPTVSLEGPLSLLITPAYAQTRFCSINALIAGILSLGMEVASATWPLVLRTIAGRGYSGWLSGRPIFGGGGGAAKGGGAPGSTPGPEPAPPECPPPARPASRGTEPGEPGPAPAPGEPAPGEPGAVPEPEPAPLEVTEPSSKLEPYEPAYVEQQRLAARQQADEAEQAFQDALTAYRKAASDVKKPLGQAQTPEEVSLALKQQVAEQEMTLKSAQRAAARDRQLQWERMGPANDELIAAQAEQAAARRQLRAQLDAGGGFDGPAYDRWAAALQRLSNAESAFNNVQFGRPATGGSGGLPSRSQGQTQVIPKSPSSGSPAEAPASGTGRPAPGENAPSGECGGAGSGEAGSPGSGSPPSDELTALRQQYNEAVSRYEAANEALGKQELEYEAVEKAAIDAGKPIPEQSPEYRQAVRDKVEALIRRDWARWKFTEAGGRVDTYGRPIDPAPGASSMVGVAGAGGAR